MNEDVDDRSEAKSGRRRPPGWIRRGEPHPGWRREQREKREREAQQEWQNFGQDTAQTD